MATPEVEPSLRALRSRLARRVSEGSLRRVAREIGLTHSGLARFMAGSRPQTRTLQKLNAWYSATGARPAVRRCRSEYGPVLRELRRETGLTLKQVAKRSGLAWQYVGEVERCARNPTLLSVERILGAVGATWTDFGERVDARRSAVAGEERGERALP